MENNQETAHTTHTKLMLLILAFVLLTASVVGYLLSRNVVSNQNGAGTAQTPASPTSAPTLIPYPTKGTFVLKLQPSSTPSEVGSPIVLDLVATSGSDTVAGYDAVLSYDSQAFQKQSVESVQNAFRIYTYDRSTHLSISATKNLGVKEEISFVSTPILSFTFLPKKKGTFTFSLSPVGKESSKLVNESAQVTYPVVMDLRVEIK